MDIIVLVLFLSFLASHASSCLPSDRAALLDFKSSILTDTTGILSSWIGADADCCDAWEGIGCHPTTGRITTFQLQRSNSDPTLYMNGTLSPSLANLQFLEVLSISGMKQISGDIPNSFMKLRHLTQLELENNMLEGAIPTSLGLMLSSLKALSLSGNKLKGVVPPSLGSASLSGLIQLNLGRNFLTGSIPATFRNLHGLQYLDLSNNLFHGSIPSFVGRLNNLTFIDLSDNKLSGEIPTSLFSLSNVLDVSLSNNRISGEISPQIGNLNSVTTLSLSNNLINGSIPGSIVRLKNLWHLDLSRNKIQGIIPANMGEMVGLEWLDLSSNGLTDRIPESFVELREMRHVNLRNNRLCGMVPQGRPFNIFPSSSYAHNLCLCGEPLPSCRKGY